MKFQLTFFNKFTNVKICDSSKVHEHFMIIFFFEIHLKKGVSKTPLTVLKST